MGVWLSVRSTGVQEFYAFGDGGHILKPFCRTNPCLFRIALRQAPWSKFQYSWISLWISKCLRILSWITTAHTSISAIVKTVHCGVNANINLIVYSPRSRSMMKTNGSIPCNFENWFCLPRRGPGGCLMLNAYRAEIQDDNFSNKKKTPKFFAQWFYKGCRIKIWYLFWSSIDQWY